MRTHNWPDQLEKPNPTHIQQSLLDFWHHLAKLADLIRRKEHLLAAETLSTMRNVILNMMLALNGIQRPAGTIHLNGYLGESQRQVLEKTLVADSVSEESWIGCAVALTVIYRWYAPQLVDKFELSYPTQQENQTLLKLQDSLSDWPLSIETE